MDSLGLIKDVYGAITPGDEANISIARSFGINFDVVPNEPLGAKFNAALKLAEGGVKFMVLPSDDLISREWLEVFRSSDADYVSPDRCAIVDVATGRAKVLTNTPNGRRVFGAGRFFSRRVVEALDGKIWTDDKPCGLDTDSHCRIVASGFDSHVHVTQAIPICDLKTDQNIWGFDVWKGAVVHVDEALHMCPDALTRLARSTQRRA